MEATGVLSIVWTVGSILMCIWGCQRSRILEHKIRRLEAKLEESQEPPVFYRVPVAPTYMSPPTAPMYENPQ